MISKGHHYLINIGIACNFLISIDPAYPGSCSRRSIVASELRGIWILPSPWIIESIIHGEFSQGIIEARSIKLVFYFQHSFYFIFSKIKVFMYYFVFISLIFILHIIFSPSKKRPLANRSMVLYHEGA